MIIDIAKRRRELTQKLHPDNLTGDKKAQEEASKKLSQINEIYANVFRRNETREVYDRVCAYRFEYHKLLAMQDRAKMQLAANNLMLLQKQIKGLNMPRDLIEELNEVLEIIKQYKNITPSTN